MTSRFKRHSERWSNCEECILHKSRKRVVLARGRVPAEVLFVGEAPGVSENVLGIPFCGPAGKLLDGIIEQAIGDTHRFCLTNLVACIPKLGGSKVSEPPKECIDACAPRLREFVEICQPKLIIAVGQLAAKHLALQSDPSWPNDYQEEIIHPAAILRMSYAQQPLAVQRCMVIIEKAVEQL